MKFVSYLAVLVLFFGCGTSNKSDNQILQFIAQQEGVEASGIQLTAKSDPVAWTAGDSLAILKKTFDQALELELRELNFMVEKAERILKDGSGDISKEKAVQIKENGEVQIEALEAGDYSKSYLQPLHNQIEKLEASKDLVLYNIMEGTWAGSDGEEHPFKLMVSLDMSTIRSMQ